MSNTQFRGARPSASFIGILVFAIGMAVFGALIGVQIGKDQAAKQPCPVVSTR